MITLRVLLALMLTAMLPSLGVAQDATDSQPEDSDQAQSQQDAASVPTPADRVEALQGLWHVDHAEGRSANESMVGSILKVDRQAIASLSGGTCSSPGFAPVPDAGDPKQVGVDITCLGQVLASVRWNTDDPDTVDWSEPDLEIVLHRVKTAAEQKPTSGEDDAQ